MTDAELIAVLAGIVIVAINPARQFAQARNTQRESDVSTILNAIGQDVVDNKGTFGGVCSGSAISSTVKHIGTGSGLVDLSCLAPTYVASAIPTDPIGTAADTEYTVAVDSSGRYTVCAPKHAETPISGSAPYCLTR